jgi:hypothetical protein
VEEIPKTSVGKYDKKLVRSMYAEGKLPVMGMAGAERSG